MILKNIGLAFVCILSVQTFCFAQNFNAQTIENFNFGMFTVSGNSGLITVDENSLATTSQNVTMLDQSQISASRFLLTTTSVVPLNISVLAQDVYLTNQFNQIVLLQPIIPSEQSFSLSVLNPLTINIGANLILSGSSPGAYNGDIEVVFILNTE